MKISKTLFKNFNRCESFIPLYDMYQFKNAHHVMKIFNEDIKQEVAKLDEHLFSELSEMETIIFDHMFNEKNGEDLTNSEREAIAEAMLPHFTRVERVASNLLSKTFGLNDFIEQKQFSFKSNQHEYYCFLDLYQEEDDEIRIIEVKATTSKKWLKLKYQGKPFFIKDKNILKLAEEKYIDAKESNKYQELRKQILNKNHEIGKYIYDLAIERMIIENSFKQNNESYQIPKLKYYLAILNADYYLTKEMPLDNNCFETENCEEVILFVDLTKITEEYQTLINEEVKRTEDQFNHLVLDDIVVSSYCKNLNDCKFKNLCFSKALHHHSVLELYNYKYQAKCAYVNQGIIDIKDIKQNELPKINLVQQQAIINNECIIDQELIKEEFKKIKYPIYYLDFESAYPPLPRFIGERPYSQSLFQFSLHIEKNEYKCDKELDHYEYISEDAKDHRRDLAEKLIELIDLSNGGTVIVYNDTYEKTRLNELATFYPDLKSGLDLINSHIYDLFKLIKGNVSDNFNFYHPAFYGSLSIKKVLPALTNVNYQMLDVQNGQEAASNYFLMVEESDKEEALRIRNNLSAYCKQDTYSMVAILWKIKEVVKDF